MSREYNDSILKAKSFYKDFKDVLHDLNHTERVVANARLIAREIGYKDLAFLEVCAYWHDVARTLGIEPHEEAGAEMARKDLLSRGLGKKADLAYEAIRFHKSTANPVTVEGKIIRDADKLDIFTVNRWKKCFESDRSEKFIEELDQTIDSLPRYPDVFTYDYTKKLYAERLPAFLRYAKSIRKK